MTCGSSASWRWSQDATAHSASVVVVRFRRKTAAGPWAFLALRQRYSVFGIARRLLELMEMGADDQTAAEFVDDHAEELVELRRWARIDRFDRRAANRRLAGEGIARAGSAA
jgi:hypothetical protein